MQQIVLVATEILPVHFELIADKADLLVGLIEIPGMGAALTGQIQTFTGNMGNLHDVAVGLFGDLRLLFGGGGDLVVHISHPGDGGDDGVEGFTGASSLIDRLLADVAGGVHGGHCVAGVVLQRFNPLLDIDGGGLSAGGQLAYLVGDYRKAAPLFAGAGGFDGGIEGQQVGLLRDGADHLQYVADLAALLIQPGHLTG